MSELDQYAEYDVTCHAQGCGNAEHTLRVIVKLPDPVVFCGVCGTEIQDKTEAEPDA